MSMADLITPMAVRVAATLGLVERAGSTGGATAEELAADTGTSAPPLRALLDHLVAVGVFDLDAASDRYRPTDLGAQMHEDAPSGIKPMLDITCAGGRGELAFVDLLETVTTGAPAYITRYGRDFWADLDAEPKLRRTFDAQMNWRFQVYADQIAERFDWSRFAEIVDVGGGDGALLIPILAAHPEVRGRIVELAPTAAAAADRLVAAGLDDRASAIAGSFFDPLPTGADAYLLSDILHDWDDAEARKILVRCHEAAAPDATVVVVEPLRQRGVNTRIDLSMLVLFAGRERTIEELAALAADSGLVLQGTTPVADGRTALEFKPGPV